MRARARRIGREGTVSLCYPVGLPHARALSPSSLLRFFLVLQPWMSATQNVVRGIRAPSLDVQLHLRMPPCRRSSADSKRVPISSFSDWFQCRYYGMSPGGLLGQALANCSVFTSCPSMRLPASAVSSASRSPRGCDWSSSSRKRSTCNSEAPSTTFRKRPIRQSVKITNYLSGQEKTNLLYSLYFLLTSQYWLS